MIKVDLEKCNGCGICVDICHEHCMVLENQKVYIDTKFCSTCTQCIAICPQTALRWEHVQPELFQNDLLPSSEQMAELLKQRRTIRHFKEEKPDRQLLREIIDFGIYAPTHSHDFRVVVVDDPNRLNQIDCVLYLYNKKVYKYLFKPKLISFLIRLTSPAMQNEFFRARPKLEASLKIGRGYACIPPVILFIVGLKRIPLSLESAQYILYNMDLYARTKGWGCRNLVGNQMFFNRSRSVRKLLGIKKNEQIYGTLGIGIPSIKFRNKVEGRAFDVQWSG
jgi:nitroreductase/NAD-dependent dihydropyrimidine dehydrogenase PreA subunit